MPAHSYWTGAKFASLVAKESVKGTALVRYLTSDNLLSNGLLLLQGIILAIPYKLIEMDSTKKRVDNFYKNYNPAK